MRRLIFLSVMLLGCNNTDSESDAIANSPEYKVAQYNMAFTESERQLIIAKISEIRMNQFGKSLNATASSMIPIHKMSDGVYVIDGVLMTHNGTGAYYNYSCQLTYKGGKIDDKYSWGIGEVYIEGEKVMK